MGAIAVVIEKKLGELSFQIKLVPEQHLIEQLFPDRSDCSLYDRDASKTQEAWQPLLDEQPDILRPFQLFATPEGWGEPAAAPDEPAMHAEWSSMIAPTVHAIHAY